MKPRNRAFSLLLALLVVVGSSGGAAQAACYSDTAKHSCFEYTGLSARAVFYGWFWIVQDFGAFMANPNLKSADNTKGYMWVRATLIADDPNYVYAPTCANPNASGQCIGTYQFEDMWFNPYKQTERWVGNGVQAGDAFAVTPCAQSFYWTGKLRIESISKPHRWVPGVNVAVQSFYSYSPHTLNTGAYAYTSNCLVTYRNAWQSWSGQVPGVWDSTIKRIVIPYANYWHNNTDWPKGWATSVSMKSFATSPTNFIIENHLIGGCHGHSTACSYFNEGAIETSTPINPNETKVVDAFTFHINPSHHSHHDTVLFIRVEPLVGGLSPTTTIAPLSSGSQLCAFCP